jgi:hypothetical protein
LSRETFNILKRSKSLQTTLAAETHLAEGRDLKLGQTWNRGDDTKYNSNVYKERVDTKRLLNAV